jgi:hypothetical protein
MSNVLVILSLFSDWVFPIRRKDTESRVVPLVELKKMSNALSKYLALLIGTCYFASSPAIFPDNLTAAFGERK